MKFNLRERNLELRSCGENLMHTEEDHTTAEIVQWAGDESHCWTIAYWSRSSDGFSLHFVTNRPFDVDPEFFMRIAEKGQRVLEAL